MKGINFFLVMILSNTLGLAQIESAKGTLILVTPTTEGLLVVADKRQTFNKDKFDDKTTKIFPVGSHYAIISTGHPVFYSLPAMQKVFDASEVSVKYLNDKPDFKITVPEIDALAQHLCKSFFQTFQPFALDKWPQESGTFDNSLFMVALFGYESDSGKYQEVSLNIIYAKTPQVKLNYTLTIYDQGYFKISKPFCYGNVSLTEELQGGKDSRFDDLRARGDVKKFIIDSPSALVPHKEALSFSTWYIKENSKRKHLIDTTNHNISPTTDAALINRDGFKWLHKNQ